LTWTDYPGRSVTGIVVEALQRNGLPPHGPLTRSVCQALNSMAARCGLVIPGKTVLPSQVRNTASELALWRVRYRAGPNGTLLRCVLRLLPCDDLTQSPAWYVKVDGVKATDTDGAADHAVAAYCAAGAGLTLDDAFQVESTFGVGPGAVRTVELWTTGKCRVLGWHLYEVERDSLTTGGTDLLCDYRRVAPLSPILDADLTPMVGTVAAAIFDKMRGCSLAWNVDDPASPVVPTTAFANIWDAAAARSANTTGITAPTQYRDGYALNAAGTLSIPCLVSVYAERTSVGGTLTVRVQGDAGTGDVPVNGAAGWYTGTATLRPQANGDKFDVLLKKDVVGTTGNLYAVCVQPLIGS
jgi:hypothetical protein